MDGVAQDMEIVQKEVFGPVLTWQTWRDEDELMKLANGTDYGLAAVIFSKNEEHAMRIARQRRRGHGVGELLLRARAGGAVWRQPQLRHRSRGRQLELRFLLRCEEHRRAEGLLCVALTDTSSISARTGFVFALRGATAPGLPSAGGRKRCCNFQHLMGLFFRFLRSMASFGPRRRERAPAPSMEGTLWAYFRNSRASEALVPRGPFLATRTRPEIKRSLIQKDLVGLFLHFICFSRRARDDNGAREGRRNYMIADSNRQRIPGLKGSFA